VSVRRQLARVAEAGLYTCAAVGAGLVVAAGLTWLTLASLEDEYRLYRTSGAR